MQNFPGSKFTWPEVKCISTCRTCIVDLGWVKIRACNFFVSWPNFTNFFWLDPVEIVLNHVCFQVMISRSVLKRIVVKLESSRKSHWFFNVFCPPKFSGCGAPKSCTWSSHLAACHVAKFHEATPPGSKVLAANTLHFKPIFDPPLKKIVRGTPSPVKGALARLGHSLVRVKIWGYSTP